MKFLSCIIRPWKPKLQYSILNDSTLGENTAAAANVACKPPFATKFEKELGLAFVSEGVRTFHPMQFQPLPFQPIAFSTVHNFDLN